MLQSYHLADYICTLRLALHAWNHSFEVSAYISNQCFFQRSLLLGVQLVHPLTNEGVRLLEPSLPLFSVRKLEQNSLENKIRLNQHISSFSGVSYQQLFNLII